MRKAEIPFRRLLARRFRQAVHQQAIVVSKGAPNAVHDLRVATRRLNEILQFLKPVLPARPRRRLARRARRIRRSLGKIRNVDVMRELVKSLARRCTPQERRTLGTLAAALGAQARELRGGGRGRGGVKVPGMRERIRKLGSHLPPVNDFSTLERAGEILVARARELESAIASARTGQAPALHELRIAIKRQRYALEILEESGVHEARPALATARTLQTELGGIHDLDLLMDLVRDQVDGRSARSLSARLARERDERVILVLKAVQHFDPMAAVAMVNAVAARVAAA